MERGTTADATTVLLCLLEWVGVEGYVPPGDLGDEAIEIELLVCMCISYTDSLMMAALTA
jgi:hypothetical protein